MTVAAPLLDRTVAKVTRRRLPSLLLIYVLSFLGQADTGVSDAAYALAGAALVLGLELVGLSAQERESSKTSEGVDGVFRH